MDSFDRIERGLLSKRRKSVLDEKEIFQKIRNIPTLPFIVTKSMEIINNPRSSANDLAVVISTDQSLAAKVLRLVNSAYYGFPNPISTISQAVTILGFNTLRTLIIGVTVHDFFEKSSEGGINKKELWLHSVATAVGAKVLAKKIKYSNQEEAFLAGLLHDLGKVILDQHFKGDFTKALELSKQNKRPLFQIEKEIFGADHAEIGKYITEQWKLPSVLTEAIHWHHDVEHAKEYKTITALVNAANNLTHALNIGKSGNEGPPTVHPSAIEVLGLEKMNAQEISQEIVQGVKVCKAFLELESGGAEPGKKETS